MLIDISCKSIVWSLFCKSQHRRTKYYFQYLTYPLIGYICTHGKSFGINLFTLHFGTHSSALRWCAQRWSRNKNWIIRYRTQSSQRKRPLFTFLHLRLLCFTRFTYLHLDSDINKRYCPPYLSRVSIGAKLCAICYYLATATISLIHFLQLNHISQQICGITSCINLI